jgi:hypothetical protein
MVREWADWISSTALSQWFQVEEWVVPTSQSIHILGLSVVFGCAVLINLRLLGIGAASGRSVSRLLDSLLPWIYRALVVLLLTGAVQTIAEPMRQFGTPAFWLKMLMIPVVLGLTAVFALVSLGLWVGIIWCGRFIGYSHG